jgi:REP element-mobilizing transposase RayT
MSFDVKVDATSSRVSINEKRLEAASTLFNAFDPSGSIGHLSGNLPHWRQEGVTYFVTFRTADSLPKEKVQTWICEREKWLKENPEPHSGAQRRDYWERFSDRLQYWLDQDYGACVLRQPALRTIVEDTLRHHDNDRYRLDEFVVMPNHVHAIVTPLGGHLLSSIVHSWKSFTAHKINKVLGQHGAFWQKESFDHIVRSAASLEKFRQYIRDNPKNVVAKKVDAASSRVSYWIKRLGSRFYLCPQNC